MYLGLAAVIAAVAISGTVAAMLPRVAVTVAALATVTIAILAVMLRATIIAARLPRLRRRLRGRFS